MRTQYQPKANVRKDVGFFSVPYFMNIKRSIIHRANDSKQTQKAVALALYCKDHLGVDYIDNFSYNKLHNITGMHDTTLRKRVKTLLKMGLAFMQKDRLVFARIKKDQKRNNFSLDTTGLKTIRDYEKLVVISGIAVILHDKELAKNVIDNLHNPKCLKDLKEARQLARSYGYTSYKENGISYDYMAKKFGCSIKTMVEIVKFATKKGFLALKKNVETFFAHSICWRLNKNNSQFTFTTKNYAYIVHANSYSKGSAIAW